MRRGHARQGSGKRTSKQKHNTPSKSSPPRGGTMPRGGTTASPVGALARWDPRPNGRGLLITITVKFVWGLTKKNARAVKLQAPPRNKMRANSPAPPVAGRAERTVDRNTEEY